MLKDFKTFAFKGNVVDLAVGVIIGTAFGKIVTSFVEDIVMPPIGILLGKVNFTNFYLSLTGTQYDSLAAAKQAGAPTINYGLFITNIINFLIIAFVVYLMSRQINRLKAKPEPTPSTKRACPYCFTDIPKQASKCCACTATVEPIQN